jgi:5-methylcytosine-specific restriction endonuclease McrA
VFERDGYRCHLCKRMTKRGAVVPHPKAPVIDHLVPLGPGDDAMHNVATACFMCNSKRRDVGPAQLILFG